VARIGLSVAEVATGTGPVSGPGVDEAVALGREAPDGDLAITPTAATLLSHSGITLDGDPPTVGGVLVP
jgi:hypothetical protein